MKETTPTQIDVDDILGAILARRWTMPTFVQWRSHHYNALILARVVSADDQELQRVYEDAYGVAYAQVRNADQGVRAAAAAVTSPEDRGALGATYFVGVESQWLTEDEWAVADWAYTSALMQGESEEGDEAHQVIGRMYEIGILRWEAQKGIGAHQVAAKRARQAVDRARRQET